MVLSRNKNFQHPDCENLKFQISFLDEPGGPAGRSSAGVRRVPHSRGVGGTARARRTTNVHNANHHHSQTTSGNAASAFHHNGKVGMENNNFQHCFEPLRPFRRFTFTCIYFVKLIELAKVLSNNFCLF